MSADIIAFPDPRRPGGIQEEEARFRATLEAAQQEIHDLKITSELSLISVEAMIARDLDRMIAIRNVISERLKQQLRKVPTSS